MYLTLILQFYIKDYFLSLNLEDFNSYISPLEASKNECLTNTGKVKVTCYNVKQKFFLGLSALFIKIYRCSTFLCHE